MNALSTDLSVDWLLRYYSAHGVVVVIDPNPQTQETPMYMLHVSYTKAPAEVEPHIEAHRKWVANAMLEGSILFAGVKKSGLGGIVAVKSMAKKDLLKLLAEDSYVQADVVEYQIIDFDCKAAQPNIADLVGV